MFVRATFAGTRAFPSALGRPFSRAALSSHQVRPFAQATVVVTDFKVQTFENLRKAEDPQNRGVDVAKEGRLEDVLEETPLVGSVKEDIQSVSSYLTASPAEIMKRRVANTIAKHQRFPGDTGSTEVQVAVLSERIEHLREHMSRNNKDKHTKRFLVKYFHER